MKIRKLKAIIILSFTLFLDSSLSLAFSDFGVIDGVLTGDAVFDNAPIKEQKRCFGTMKVCCGIRAVKTKEKVVALTFDDGPHKKHTEEVLAILKLHDIKATFFVIGKNVAEYPNVVKATYAAGHIIGNHTYSHKYLSCLSSEDVKAELLKADEIIRSKIGVLPILFRPPYGACTRVSAKVAKELGFKTIMWSSDYPMDRMKSPEEISTMVVNLVKPGGIILLHDGGGNRDVMVKALPLIIMALKNSGYTFVTIPDLLKINFHPV